MVGIVNAIFVDVVENVVDLVVDGVVISVVLDVVVCVVFADVVDVVVDVVDDAVVDVTVEIVFDVLGDAVDLVGVGKIGIGSVVVVVDIGVVVGGGRGPTKTGCDLVIEHSKLHTLQQTSMRGVQ